MSKRVVKGVVNDEAQTVYYSYLSLIRYLYLAHAIYHERNFLTSRFLLLMGQDFDFQGGDWILTGSSQSSLRGTGLKLSEDVNDW